MSRDDHAHLYRAVPVLFWPWLWWQLFRLRLWSEASGRDVLFGVDRWGNLHVHLVGDDPGCWAPSRHPHLHQYYLTDELANETRLQWRARLAAVFCGGISMPDWVIFPRRVGETCGAEGDEVRARIRDPVERKTALSLVHGLAKPDRNLLRIACPKGLARCQTQPSPYRPCGLATAMAFSAEIDPPDQFPGAAHEPSSGLCSSYSLTFYPTSSEARAAGAGRGKIRVPGRGIWC